MARVTYGALVTELAGSIGGTSFQKNFSGNIARARPKPVRNPTAPQLEFQNNMSLLIALWPTLTQVQKDSWDTLAAGNDHIDPWGIARTISGYQWFLSQNLNVLSTGGTIVTTATAYITIAQPQDFTLQATNAVFNLIFSPAYTPPTTKTYVYATPPLRQASLKLRRSHFHIDTLNFSAQTTVSIKTAYEDYFRLNWANFFDNSNCSIIVRLKALDDDGYFSSTWVSTIIKIN